METLMLICGLIGGYLIYRQGIKDGLTINDGGKPELPNPVTYVQNIKEDNKAKKEDQESMDAFENLMAYNGEKQPGGE